MAPMSKTERAKTAANALHAGRTAEQRSSAGSHAYLAGAVGSVCRRWQDLTEDQRTAIRQVACS